MANLSAGSVGFSTVPALQMLSTAAFLLIYLAAFLGNVSILIAVTLNTRLHTPVYFFVKHLSLADLCSMSTTLPRALVDTMADTREFSLPACVSRLFAFVCFGSLKCFLITSEAFSTFHTVNAFSLPFCGPNVLDHFFCDIPPLLHLACGDTEGHAAVGFAVGGCVIMTCFVLSYVLIVFTEVHIRSSAGCWKAFSTCSSHLATVLLFYGTGSSAYMQPTAHYSPLQGRMAAIFYSIFTPTLNPLIYSLRNKDVEAALKKVHPQVPSWNLAFRHGKVQKPTGIEFPL
ncbi:LOW QUALITY PROTEIN: olfactory receptor 5V1-like [Phodopus roborovskii]|uniref:LOW QUALITY PROTEIN: olfactory receptor 5V1-like n=1 Tax=Phodopus roborovskii TaxID=109678 RepID=UPI0021E3ED86|nr:LOW QUALITY PROTEIN: olfactory receptor 5V1-like [Phodopus roborovskii]